MIRPLGVYIISVTVRSESWKELILSVTVEPLFQYVHVTITIITINYLEKNK